MTEMDSFIFWALVAAIVLIFAVGRLYERVKDLELDIARQKSRISNLEWDK